MNTIIQKFLVLYMLLATRWLPAKVLIFDLGGVLFDADKIGVARHIGLSYFMSYAIFDRKNPNVQSLVFETLKKIDQDTDTQRTHAGNSDGTSLPGIMTRWQAGEISGPEVIRTVQKQIPKLVADNFFSSKREQILVQRTINAMFTPNILAENMKPMKAGIDLAIECARARAYDGSRLNRIIIFSNWDELSFEPFYRKHRHIFRELGDPIISAHIKYIKPQKEAFAYLLDTYGLKPHECICIDDQKMNVDAAKKYGIRTIWFRNRNYKKLRKQLIKLGALIR